MYKCFLLFFKLTSFYRVIFFLTLTLVLSCELQYAFILVSGFLIWHAICRPEIVLFLNLIPRIFHIGITVFLFMIVFIIIIITSIFLIVSFMEFTFKLEERENKIKI